MDTNQKVALAEAANALIDDQDAKDLYKKLQAVYELANRNVPVRLTGRAAVINPLLDMMLEDFPASERVLQLIDRKRKDRGMEALDDEVFDRKAYMREFMATKRERQRRLVELTNELRSEDDKLKGSNRMEFERIHAARWLDVKTEREDAMRERLGRRLTAEERKAVIAEFWKEVDLELDELEAFVAEEVRKPLFRRAPNGFNFKLKKKG
jgi:hypothetical protein